MSTVVRLPAQTQAQLADLAARRGQPAPQVLAALVDAAWRAAWLEAANAEYAAWMAEHPEEYAAHQAETRLWETRLADGLAPEE
jgi:hypothetical protein